MNDFEPQHPELIRVDSLAKAFSGVQALADVSLSIASGEIHGLVGENGSGKSTLIKIIAGVLDPDRGSLTIQGKQFSRLQPIIAIRLGIQVIYQDFSLFPNLTIEENIALNSELAQNRVLISRNRMRRVAQGALEKLGIQLDLGVKVEEIPVSQWQLVAISRALVQGARLIIMDEPTTTLTRKEVEALLEITRRLKASGVATLFVNHKLNEVCELADRISVLRNGRITASLEPAEFDPPRITECMTGRRPVPRAQSAARPKSSSPLLKVQSLSRAEAYSDINFELQSGEILGLTGLLGSGQTELALGIFGLLPVESGKVFIKGKEVQIRDVSSALEHGIAYVPEDRLREGLFLEHSTAGNLAVTMVDRLAERFSVLRSGAVNEMASKWIEALEISTPSPELPVQSLSGGNQQRVVIGRWLATSPEILIMNNPTAGVDVGSKFGIHQLLRRLVENQKGVLLISDDLSELLENCDRILVMGQGRLVREFAVENIDEVELSREILAGGV
ncbi:MAG TPA: sugar ABC transporter ATP-binding protein [Acidobacteriota bacterium]|nr:sugar ABC transporter ATP-binding protein [Acidobacteriota bacterium]